MSRRRRPPTFTVVKDIVSWMGGWALIVHESLVTPSQFNLWRLLIGGALVGVPGFGQLLAMRTGASPSPPPEPDSSPPSSSSSSTSGADR
jgi:hypothetical protein